MVARLFSETGSINTFLGGTGQLHKEDFVEAPRPEHNVWALGSRVDLWWEYNFLTPDLNQELPIRGADQSSSSSWSRGVVVAVDYFSQQGQEEVQD
jgi:hypothetical protein